jgi:IclR family transcriptional regulator, KDG regulon repressor
MSVSITSVDRALDILICFDADQPVLSLTQIATQLNLPKSTIHRHLATLENKRFLTRDDATGMYRLGFRFIAMANLILQESGFRQWTQSHLERLSAEFDETVDLAVLDGTDVIYLQVIESSQRVKIAAAVGQRLPAYCTASGKAFLAFLPPEQVRTFLNSKLARYTEKTRVTIPDLTKDFQEIQKRGFAISDEEYEKDIRAVAAPILDANGYPVAVIAVAGPSYRLSLERMNEIGRSIRSATEAVSREGGLALMSALNSNMFNAGVTGQTIRRGHL